MDVEELRQRIRETEGAEEYWTRVKEDPDVAVGLPVLLYRLVRVGWLGLEDELTIVTDRLEWGRVLLAFAGLLLLLDYPIPYGLRRHLAVVLGDLADSKPETAFAALRVSKRGGIRRLSSQEKELGYAATAFLEHEKTGSWEEAYHIAAVSDGLKDDSTVAKALRKWRDDVELLHFFGELENPSFQAIQKHGAPLSLSTLLAGAGRKNSP